MSNRINLREPGAIEALLAFHRSHFGGLRMENETPDAPTPTPADVVPPAQAPDDAPNWDELFKGQDPKKVKEALENSRKWEARAKENKAAADRLAEIEEASKTEAQKQADRLATLEREAQQAKAEALRFKIAAKFQVSDEDADLFLTGSDEETLTKQAERLAARNEEAGKPRAPKPDPNQGRTPNGVPLDPRSADLAQIEADLQAAKRR